MGPDSGCSLCYGGLLFCGGCVHYHVDVRDNATRTLQSADGSGYALCRGDAFRDDGAFLFDVLLLGLLVGGLTLTVAIGVLSFCNLLMNVSVVFLVHPLSLVSLLKYFSASLTATA